jgi:hypothetical protein
MTETPDQLPKRQLSEAELAQRRAASVLGAAAATGPRTEEGKAVSSRNAWKHGLRSDAWQRMQRRGELPQRMMLGRPCVTTCAYHPDNPNRTEHPCGHVVRGETRAGGDCVDRTVYADAFERVIEALDGQMDAMHGLLARQVAEAIEVLHLCKREIAENGIVMEIPAISKESTVVLGPDGKPAPGKFISNPALAHYTRLLEVLGINLPELLATPRSKAREQVETDTGDAVQALLGGIFARGRKGAPTKALPKPEGDGE